ncbi:mitochondrial arginine transporter BAC2 [Momordica charantia]|uniref:Mitochondrial arginine transporter BAC2 n=1 Tax=Momordica charantia TaxID=3673 RepID=A0A6J1DQG6_MOMCH|nr:mitochondrial arginine transporter BAC2 [Momordica charantia]
MDFWPEFLASSWGKEFVAGGFGGIAGIISGYPLDTLRIRQQQSASGSAVRIFRNIIAHDGLAGLYRGMAAPLASVTFQNAAAFQIYAVLSRAFNSYQSNGGPPTYKATRLQAQTQSYSGIVDCLDKSVKEEGYRVLWRGLGTAVARAFLVNGPIFVAYEMTLRCLLSNGTDQSRQ